MKLLTNELQELYKNPNKKIKGKYTKNKKYCKVKDRCPYTEEYRDPAHSMCKLKYSEPKKTPIVFFTMDLTMIILLS